MSLEWALVEGNDTAIRLAAAAMLLLACRRIDAEHGLEGVDRMTADCEPRHQMKIQAALALSHVHRRNIERFGRLSVQR